MSSSTDLYHAVCTLSPESFHVRTHTTKRRTSGKRGSTLSNDLHCVCLPSLIVAGWIDPDWELNVTSGRG